MNEVAEISLLTRADIALFQDLRLRALKEEPRAFLDAHEEAMHWPQEKFLRYFENGWIAGIFVGERLLGMAGLYRHKGARVQHKGTIWGVFAAAEIRSQGLMRRAMERLIQEAKEAGIELVTLSANVANPVAQGLYESLGFEPCGTERHILKMPDGSYVDDVAMIRFL